MTTRDAITGRFDDTDAINRVRTDGVNDGAITVRFDAGDAINRVRTGKKKVTDLSVTFKVAITYSSAFAVPSA